MTALAWLIPCALLLGLLGLAAFLWSLHSGQFEDLEGAGWRALQDDDPAPHRPLPSRPAALSTRPAHTGRGAR
jgi:cbb3-type cytochrome oxidase maturation protein